MSWREEYRTGSFRGAAFRTSRVEGEGGRRGVVHEFPQRDKPGYEDLGRAVRRFTIDCWVGGEDYYAERDALQDALEQLGPGTLVHPFKGTLTVAVENYRVSEEAAEGGGGIATFAISFVEAGELPAAPAKADTAARSRAVAEAEAMFAAQEFGGCFSVSGATGFVQSAAGDLVSGAALSTSIAGGLLGGAGPALRAFDTGLRLLPENISGLLRSPIELGRSVVGLVQTVGALGNSVGRIAAFSWLMRFGEDLDPVLGNTPARILQRDNQRAIVSLVTVAASTELVRAVASTTFASYEDAIETRDQAADQLDILAIRAADAGDDGWAGSFDRLRRALVRDVTSRGGTLARLQGYTPAHTEPALVIAQRIYGVPREIASRAAEIVARNAVRHPSLVPGGQPLQLLTPNSTEATRG
jgi:prophage DNA circulation protein